jgi:hypothetical protein
MKTSIFFSILLSLSLAGSAFAADAPSRRNTRRSTTTSAAKASKPTGPRPSYRDLTIGFITWQESIKAMRPPDSTQMQTQSLGTRISYAYNRFYSGAWRYHHSVDFAFGTLKGKGGISKIQDEIKNQLWAMATLSPGLIYRTSPVSELGLGLPLSYRFIQWKFESGSNFSMDKGSSFSAGIAGLFGLRFNPKSGIEFMVQHQHMWNAVIWTASYTYVY